MSTWRRSLRLGLGVWAGALVSGVAVAQDPQPVAMAEADWSALVWSSAAEGREPRLLELLERVPAEARAADTAHLLVTNIGKREAQRAEQLARVGADLDKALAEGSSDLVLSHALKHAVELYLLSIDKPAVLAQPRIARLERDALGAARAAEDRGDYFNSSELFARLYNLREEQGTYKDDIQRVGQRLAMIRLYAPERFWQLRAARRDAELSLALARAATDEERTKANADYPPLPPYNPTGDDFREKLRGISDAMVLRAISQSAAKHVEHVTMSAILRGGLAGLRTMLTTQDLAGTFPGIAEEGARQLMLDFIRREDDRLAQAGAIAGSADLMSLVDRLLETNRQSVRLPDVTVLHEFGNGAMASLDEFSGIIWPAEMPRFERSTQGTFVGVGVQIQHDELDNLKVVTPLEGTPAHRAGILPGDLIKKVNGQTTIGFSLDQAVDVITGTPGTTVTLTIDRPGDDGNRQEMDVELTRAVIPLVSVKGWRREGARDNQWDWFIDPASGVGYVRLTQFSEHTDAEFDEAIAQMKPQGLHGLILDLRFNPGGLLDQAVAIASRFIDPAEPNDFRGVIVSTHAQNDEVGKSERAQRRAASLAKVPVIVLINEGSASASEIVCGAIQDYAKGGSVQAVVVGQRSYGKGSVQNVWDMSGSGARAAIKLTTQYYRLPGGRLIHRKPDSSAWGVAPDLSVEMLPEQIADAYRLRQDADVVKLGSDGKPLPGETTPDPARLISEGSDLQLHHALVLLQSRIAANAEQRAGLDKTPGVRNN